VCVEAASCEEKEVDCSVAKTNNDGDIEDGDCDVMLQSCEEVLTDEPNDVACVRQREKRSFTRTGSLPKKWKDSVNSRTKAWGRSMAPPYRLTPDGTIVNYWCDLPRKSVTGSHGMSFAVAYFTYVVHCSLPLHGFPLAVCCMFSRYTNLITFALVLNGWNHIGYLHSMWCNRRCTFLLRF